MFDCTNFVFNITSENNKFSINIPRHWQNNTAERTIYKLNKLLELRSFELHVLNFRKGGHQIKIGDRAYKLTDFDTLKEEILEVSKNIENIDPEDMVYRFQLTYDEIINIKEFKYIPTKSIGYSLKPDIYQISNLSNTLKTYFTR